jgi:hypothetical protein
MKIKIVPLDLSIVQLEKNAGFPSWGVGSFFYSVTRTDDEVSVVCETRCVPPEAPSEGGWTVLKIEGPLNLHQIGILKSILDPLAKNRISVFVISTYNTDYVLVKKANLKDAIDVLKKTFEVIE